MQQRERVARAVDGRAADHDEARTLVEARGQRVLLVHVERAHAPTLDGMGEQRAAHTGAARGIVHEQHLQMAVLGAGEAHGGAILPGYRKAPDGSEARGHLRAQARDIVLGEEPVRGAHGALPHLRQPAHQLGRAPLRLDLFDVHGCSFRMLPPGRFAPF